MKGRFMAIGAALVAAFVLAGGTVAAGAADVVPKTKEAAPTLEKRVLENSTDAWGTVADAEVGEDVAFSIKVSLEDCCLGQSLTKCRIVDELPSGMEPDLDSVRVGCGTKDITGRFEIELAKGVLALTTESLDVTELESPALDITYTARLTADSPVGGSGSVNSARLELEVDGEDYVTPESRTALFTYRLNLTKVDAQDHTKHLAGARFLLSRADGLYATVHNGVLAGWTESAADATRLASDADGQVSVSGLDSGQYRLNEEAAPNGYLGLSRSIDFEIRSDLAFDVANQQGVIDRLELASGSASSRGNASQGTLLCMVENPRVAQSPVPSTGDTTRDPWPFALLGGGVSGSILFAKRRARRTERRAKHRPAHMAAVALVTVACLLGHGSCSPIRALAQDDTAPLVIGQAVPDETVSSENTLSNLGERESLTPRSRSGTPLLLAPVQDTAAVTSEADIPRSPSNSYINVLNMSYENAYVMVNDTASFAYSGSSPTNTFINWSFGETEYAGRTGQSISAMVLYRGAPGAHGASNDTWGVDTVTDSTGKGLVGIWFRDAGVLSDTGESVSMLLTLRQYQLEPNYRDYFNYMDGGSCKEAVRSYREFCQSGQRAFPLLYIFKSAGVDQTDPANARVWMNAIWSSGQMWDISFYRSGEEPTYVSALVGYSFDSLGLDDGQKVSLASNGETYLARQYCYDLDIAGIRWLDHQDGSYSSSSPLVTPGNDLYALGGAYLTRAGAESFAWVDGAVGSSYVSTSSNLKNDSFGGLAYWLHDYNRRDGGTQTGYRWKSSGSSNHNTDWRNALAADVLPSSSFAWVGTDCATGINLNSQFTGTGSLRIQKSVDDGNTQAFPFSITLEAPSYASGTLSWVELTDSFGYAITDADGATLESGSLQSGDAFRLAHGQTFALDGLPEGTRYTVREESHEGYRSSLADSAAQDVSDGFGGTIVNGTTSTLHILNERMLAPATWAIVKEGSEGERLPGAEFEIRFFADGADMPTRVWTLRSDADGVARLDADHLVSGDGFFFDADGNVGLPLGAIEIEETLAPSGYMCNETTWRFEVRDVGSALECTVPAELVVENACQTGSLTIAKQVEGAGADPNRDFSFTVALTLDGTPLSGTFGDVSFTDGFGAFALKSGQAATLSGIPAGTRYEIHEEEVDGYRVSWVGRTGTIVADETLEAQATNRYAATGSLELLFSKVYDSDGPALADGQFSFALHEGSPDGPVLDTASCDADGTIRFTLPFDSSDIGQTYSCFVSELDDGQRGVEYDAHAAVVRVRVINNGDGTLSFETAYEDEVFTNTYRSYELPDTGLGGVFGSIGAGSTLVAAGALALVRRKRRRLP